MLHMSKRFGSFQALQDVSMTVEKGSFHALLGENGAGKSTLVKALIGFQPADEGAVTVDGREHEIKSPRDAARLGLGMIFQHFTLAPGMTVAENLALASDTLPGWIDWTAERRKLDAFMATAPFPLPLDRRCAELSAGEKQKLEILKQLYTRRRFLVLDEPTSVLTPQEADEVLGRMKAMTQSGALSVLIITHKFREVFGYCDAVTVLRRGRLAGEAKVADVDRDTLAGWMMGADATTAASAVALPTGLPAALQAELDPTAAPPAAGAAAVAANEAPRLALHGVSVADPASGRLVVDGVSLAVAPGEIVGIAGVSGNGQRELMAALTGVLPLAVGRLQVDGQPYAPTRKAARRAQVASLPEEPLHNACVGRLSVEENLALRNFDVAPLKAAGLYLSRSAMRAQALTGIANFKVKTTGPAAPIASLSGGNVQRAVLARELSSNPRLLLVANPCFGLDFQAAAEIHARLRAARAAGCGVLLISEDLDELIALADRLLVMSHGHIALEVPVADRAAVDIAALGRAMAGETSAGSSPEPLARAA
jgi:simple sugar transport system ATP-binding protein